MIKWHDFKSEKPTENKYYLWALNNWNVGNGKGQRVHSSEVNILHWDGRKFIGGGANFRDPDQWAEIPYPEPAKRPTDDLTFSI